MIKITKIQKYSIHDGDGIRTTVFFKGCPLRCVWCHNPETMDYKEQVMLRVEACTGCASCETACPKEAIVIEAGSAYTDRKRCVRCGECVDECINNLREISGREYAIEELVEEIRKDQVFYEQSGGGVTLSGGEVMTMNMDDIEELLKRLNKLGISINIDTCGYAPYENFQRVLPFVDTFLYDVKIMNDKLHRKYTGVDNRLILENLVKLSRAGARIYLRLPIIDGINTMKEETELRMNFLRENNIKPERIDLLPYHDMGKGKYQNLGLDYRGEGLKSPDIEGLNEMKMMYEENGFVIAVQ